MKFLTICLFAVAFVFPQSEGKFIFQTGEKLFSNFSNYDSEDYVILTVSATSIVIASMLDETLRGAARKNQSALGKTIFGIDKYYGDVYTFIPVVGTYIYGISTKNAYAKNLGIQLITASAYAGLITSTFKSALGRNRPQAENGNFTFDPFSFEWNKTSFPSGHSSWTWAVSTVLAGNTDNKYLKIFFYSASGLVAAARIYNDAHWFSDTVAGSLLGYFVGDFVVKRFNQSEFATASTLAPSRNLFAVTIYF